MERGSRAGRRSLSGTSPSSLLSSRLRGPVGTQSAASAADILAGEHHVIHGLSTHAYPPPPRRRHHTRDEPAPARQPQAASPQEAPARGQGPPGDPDAQKPRGLNGGPAPAGRRPFVPVENRDSPCFPPSEAEPS